jgi:uncharacterized RDD family membrane protein YckC
MENEDLNFIPRAEQADSEEGVLSGFIPEGPVPAGFNERFLAYVIDAFPFVAGTYLSLNAVINAGVIASTSANELKWKLLWIGAYIIYETVLSSGGRATLGKLLMRIRVRSRDGQNLSAGRAFVRSLAYFLSSATLNLGYLAALVTPDKRALHDYVAGSCVISLRERGDFYNGLVLAFSWGLMAVFTGSWLNQTVLKLSPSEKSQIIAAYRTISKLGKLEEIYLEREGHYTDDLKPLAGLTGNVNAVRAELYKTLEPGTLTIASNGRKYVITAKARNWRKTEVQISSEGSKGSSKNN